jgi:multiple sugar transport system permease protein
MRSRCLQGGPAGLLEHAGVAQIPTMARHIGMGCPVPAKASLRRRQDVLAAYLLLAPSIILVLGILAYPLAWEVWTSFTNRSIGLVSARYVGLDNYLGLLGNAEFWRAAERTAGYIVVTGVLKLALGLAIALALARPFPGRPLVFLAAFLPWAYPAGVAVVGWYLFTTPPIHTVYSALMADLGFFFDNWLGAGTWGFLSLIVFNVWRGGSFTGIFLLAALNGIPQELFDYASLEVRHGWRRFSMVTVPLLRPFLALAVFLALTSVVADLGNVWVQTGRRDVYPIVWTHAWRSAIFGGQWGVGSALSLILVPALAAFLLASFRLFEPLEDR